MTIHYLQGDATSPQVEGKVIIAHVCNDLGKWGRGFVLAISRKWKQPELQYKSLFLGSDKPQLGHVQFVEAGDDIVVANIIGQHGIRSPRNTTAPAPIRYDAVREGLEKIGELAIRQVRSVHMPRIGCGLAGGTWDKIEPLIEQTLVSVGVDVYVYDF
tara:strand:+ start:5040 stop:5513 length:474 start_codon:yes stop_codon:yes gene_type:complete